MQSSPTTSISGDDDENSNSPHAFSYEDNSDNSSSTPNLDLPLGFEAQGLGNNICCIGAGRLGILTMTVLATQWEDLQFYVLDENPEIIQKLNTIPRVMPFSEPGLEDMINGCTNLHFSSDIAGQLVNCQVFFIAVDVPLMNKPKVVKGNLDIQNCEDAIRAILYSPPHQVKYVAIKSTFPVDLNSHFADLLKGYEPSELLHVIMIPEFFSEGTALEDLTNPPKVVMGRFFNTNQATQDLFASIYLRLVHNNPQRIEYIDSHSSVQIAKCLSNASIAAQLTVMNIGSSICDRVGARFSDVKRAFEGHPRMTNPFYQDSRAGYGGLGLTKDVTYLAYLCDCLGLVNEKKFFILINEMRLAKMDELVRNIIHRVGSGKTIAIFGFSNKVYTDDVRESPSLYICRSLLKKHDARLVIYDPVVPRNKIKAYFARTVQNRLVVAENREGAWEVEVMVFMVRWPEFEVMLQEQKDAMLAVMMDPKFIFDCCDLIPDGQEFEHTTIYRLGNPT